MRVLLFFSSNGIIGGAERRLLRIFYHIKRQEPTFSFDVWLLMLKHVDEEMVIKEYHSIADVDLRFFYKKSYLINAIKGMPFLLNL